MNWNVKDVEPKDIELINELKAEKNLPSNQLLHLLLKKYISVTHASTEGNPQLEEKLKEVTQNLEKVSAESQELVTQLQQALTEAMGKITDLEAQLQEANQKPNITPPAFVFTPTEKINTALDLVKDPFYKKGFTKNPDQDQYRNELTKYAIRYLIENEFSKYLKA